MSATFTLRCWRDAALLLAGFAVLAALVTRLDGGAQPPLSSWLATLAPVALAAAVAARWGRLRRQGALDAWEALGHRPARLLRPLLISAALAALTAAFLPVGPAWGQLPAPVDPGLLLWWDQGWGPLPSGSWMIAPAELSLPDLLARLLRPAPPGARAHVDLGDLLRRLCLAGAWLLAIRVGARRDPATAAALVTAWLTATALLVGAYSMT